MNVIDRLNNQLLHLENGAEQLVEILANEGADVANGSYSEYPVTATAIASGTTGEIKVEGKFPLIAEFGAGDQTLSDGFENTPAEARPGSYSEEHARQYSRWGFWYFGGQVYNEVYPHHGLRDAKRYIIKNSESIAREVMTYD